jgi:uncharacterized protein (TIGR02594 family)
MRKFLIGVIAVIIAVTAGTGDAEAAKKRHKRPNKNKAVHHRVHKHPVKKHYVIGQQTQTQVIHLAAGPQCGFWIFASDCNGNARNNIHLAEKYDGMTSNSNRDTLASFMGVDPRRTAWCAAFVNAVLKQNGFSNTESLMASSYLNYGTKTLEPQPGDVVVFSPLGRGQATGHVGFYVDTIEQDGAKYILSLGGNQDGGVNISAYPARKVRAFRRPLAVQNI